MANSAKKTEIPNKNNRQGGEAGLGAGTIIARKRRNPFVDKGLRRFDRLDK